MNKTGLLNTYFVVATLGLVDAVYLTYTRFMGITPPCSIGAFSECATVAKSSYSVLLGIPLSVYGIIFYTAALVLVFLELLNKPVKKSLQYIFYISVLGALSSAYFLVLQGFVIKAFCIYCIFSAICTFILLALAKVINTNTLATNSTGIV